MEAKLLEVPSALLPFVINLYCQVLLNHREQEMEHIFKLKLFQLQWSS